MAAETKAAFHKPLVKKPIASAAEGPTVETNRHSSSESSSAAAGGVAVFLVNFLLGTGADGEAMGFGLFTMVSKAN